MSKKRQKSVADIVADLRALSDKWIADKSMTKIECLGVIAHQIANRVESAWKREKSEIEASALSVGGIVEASRHTPGNAAAMREALLAICETYREHPYDHDDDAIANIADVALAAPARNCDKMPGIDNLTMHDIAKSPCKSTLEYASREELLALVRWLLAPAEEGGAE